MTRLPLTFLNILAVACVVLITITSFAGRPAIDDYWAFERQFEDGFWGSLVWYYTSFQGNVTSWFFILVHEQQWFSGLTVMASALSILSTLIVLGAGVWGGLNFLGFSTPSQSSKASFLIVSTTVVWLSLASLVSPNAFTAVFYTPSTIVHIWPWAFGLFALGLIYRKRAIPGVVAITAITGFLAGSLGFVEGALIAVATLILYVWNRIWPGRQTINRAGWGWAAGLALGLGLQLLSPATWDRSGDLGREGVLTTNVEAAERLITAVDTRLGGTFTSGLLDLADIEVWARGLVPVAVFGDLLLRPGLVAVIFLAGWFVMRIKTLVISKDELRRRLAIGIAIAVVAFIGYSMSGAIYAYAGRHVAGLALIISVLAAGWGAYFGSKWNAKPVPIIIGMTISILIISGLATQQLLTGLGRASDWDAALDTNRQLISNGQINELVDVRFQAGISSSGLRDHGGSNAYIRWVTENSNK